MDGRDWFVIGHVAMIMTAATAFLFMYPNAEDFATWGGVVATTGGLYHWIMVRDSKIPDAPNEHSNISV
jgi:uncharacterized membrane protein